MTANRLPASTPHRRHFGLRWKALLGLTVFNVVATGIFAFNHYLLSKEHLLQQLHDSLSDFVAGLDELLPPGYLDRAVAATAIAEADYQAVVEKLNGYCREVGLHYLYTCARTDQGFHFTASNETEKDRATNLAGVYWDRYDDAPPALQQAWEHGHPVFARISDRWGDFYSLFKPLKTAAGTRYIAGADLDVDRLDQLLLQSVRRSLLVGALVFAGFLSISYYASVRFSAKLVQLAAYTRELVELNFRPNPASPLRQQVATLPERARDEVGDLAHSFIVMENQLGSYLRQLEAETAAKERAQNELRIAGEIQATFLPQAFPSSDRLDLHATVRPAKEAGGDFYDFFQLDADHLCFSIGDVSDKGMPAALFMAVALTTLRAKATPALVDAPEEILRQTNEQLIPQNQSCQFVTMFLGLLDLRTGLVTYSDGGHNRPYHRPAGGAAQMISIPPREGIALGVMPGAAFRRHTLQLQPGETLFLYTDGVTEAIAADDTFYREARLERTLSRIAPATPARGWVDTVMAEVQEFTRGHVQSDDITMLALRLKP